MPIGINQMKERVDFVACIGFYKSPCEAASSSGTRIRK